MPPCATTAAAAALLAALLLGGGCLDAPPHTTGSDAARAIDAAGEPDGPVAAQLLVDPDFEERAADWMVEGNAHIGDDGELSVSFTAASGTVFAQLGRANNVTADRVRQRVVVPPWTRDLTLRAQHCFTTDDDDRTADDVFAITLADTGGEPLEELMRTSNAELGPICQWTELTATAAAAYAGEEIQLVFAAATDASLPTGFWLDDVRLIASP